MCEICGFNVVLVVVILLYTVIVKTQLPRTNPDKPGLVQEANMSRILLIN